MFQGLIDSSDSPRSRSRSSLWISAFLHLLVAVMVLLLPYLLISQLPAARQIRIFILPDRTVPEKPSVKASIPKHPNSPVKPVRFVVPDTVPSILPPPDVSQALPSVASRGVDEVGGAAQQGWGSTTGVPIAGIPVERPLLPLVPPPPPALHKKTPLRVSVGAQGARLIHKVLPIFPDLARRVGVSGVVVLQVSIDERGVVTGVRVVRGHPLLVPAAVEAVKQWRYSPTLLNGNPVPVRSTVTVSFRLH